MLKHPIDLLQLPSRKQNQFEGKGLTTIEDLAYFFPRRYIDFRKITPAKDVVIGDYCAMAGIVTEIREYNNMYAALVEEEQPVVRGYRPQFAAVWFGTDYHIKKLVVGERYVFCGKTSDFHGQLQINTPLAFSQNPAEICKIMPIYSKIQGMSNNYLLDKIKMAINYLVVNERVGEKELFADSLHLMPKFEAIRELHQPTGNMRFRRAQERMAYETIYDFYAELKQKDLYLIGTSIQAIQKDTVTRRVISSLPFQLTPDQQVTIDTVIREAAAGRRIHSLVSGDVGCGKTMVAILSAIFMWENGYQTILMAPTLVLAQQHLKEFQGFAQQLGMTVGLLTTETKKKDRTKLLSDFADGSLDVLIGTHAVLNQDIEPKILGMTIIDEEHKFGVKQKARLEDFDKAGIHHLKMTATPIPRSIAMTVYGSDLAVLPIQTMPAGRKPIQTQYCPNCEDALEKLYEEVQKGRQGYIICPFIEDSDNPQFKDVASIASIKTAADSFFAKKPSPVRLGAISGDMKQKDILETVRQFEMREIDVLLSTTIVEVGVNVPNASAIVIMSADRFGLAALHQLRGRVGRSSDQSYCLLCAPVKNERIDVMCQTTDGFAIAEQDMRLRGPGDLTGDAQSGDSKTIDLIIKHPKLSAAIRQALLD